MPKPELGFFESDAVKGEEVFPKVIEQVLSKDPVTGNETKIQYLMPGFEGDGAYGHDYWEEIYILSGTAYCGTAKRWLKTGDYACRPPGMIHGPFSVASDGEPLKSLLINTYSWGVNK